MGDGSKGFRDGPAALARFSEPMAVAAASDGGAVYVSDYGSFRVRQLCNGIVSTLAGAGSLRFGPSVAIGAIGAPVGMYLDDRRGLLYTTSLARGARSVLLAITVLNDGQRRAIRLFPIIRTWARVQQQRAVCFARRLLQSRPALLRDTFPDNERTNRSSRSHRALY